MIRFIVQRHESDFNSGLDSKTFHTFEIDVPELEQMLSQGGRGEMGFEHWQLLGIEIVSPPLV